jgi:hypothetical protein
VQELQANVEKATTLADDIGFFTKFRKQRGGSELTENVMLSHVETANSLGAEMMDQYRYLSQTLRKIEKQAVPKDPAQG